MTCTDVSCYGKSRIHIWLNVSLKRHCHGVYLRIMSSFDNPPPTTQSSCGNPPAISSNVNSRRVIRCLVELNRPGEARDYLPQIEESPPHALTLVLQFQVSVRCDDESLGTYPTDLSANVSDKSTRTTDLCTGIHCTNVVLLRVGCTKSGKEGTWV